MKFVAKMIKYKANVCSRKDIFSTDVSSEYSHLTKAEIEVDEINLVLQQTDVTP